MLAGHVLALLDGEPLQEHAPYLRRGPSRPGSSGGAIDLEGHQLGLHPFEHAFSDLHQHIGAVYRIVQWQHDRRPGLGDTEMPVAVLLGPDRQQAMTLRCREDL